MDRQRKMQQTMLNAFGDRYYYSSYNGGYILYDKETPGRRANMLFLGRFYLSLSSGCKYVFNDDYYATVPELLEAMKKYYDSLPFDAEIYNPLNRKNYQIDCATHDYLTSLGFSSGRERPPLGSVYRLYDLYGQPVCTLDIEADFDKSTGTVRRRISGSDSWQEAAFTDIDSAIGAINSLLTGYLSVVQAQLMNCLSSLTHSRAAQVLDKTFDFHTLSTYTEDAKTKTIAFLEEELKRLKET